MDTQQYQANPGANPASPDRSPVDLSADSYWLEYTINGCEFAVETFDALDLLRVIDDKHARDPHSCLKCGATVPAADSADRFYDVRCPSCDAAGYLFNDGDAKPRDAGNIRWNTTYLDDVAELLRSKFGVRRVSRNEAWKFYDSVISSSENLKKKPG